MGLTATPASPKWRRVTRRAQCPVCHRPEWCTVSADGTAAICMRVPSSHPTKNGGHLHRLNGAIVVPPAQPPPEEKSRPELADLMRQFQRDASVSQLERHAADLGLSVESLRRLRIGWSFASRAWAFPMTGSDGGIVGIRLRQVSGRKFSVRGGHEGLFIPAAIAAAGTLLVCEGPTSCAALLDLGFNCIGRPSCSGGAWILRRLLGEGQRRDVVIVADRDEAKTRPDGTVFYPGQDGAARLAQLILPVCRSVKVIIPPVTKDARDWKRAGATRQDVERLVAAARYARREAGADGRVD